MSLAPMTTATEEGLDRDEYRTPKDIFDGLSCRFDLDVAAPLEIEATYHCPADRRLTKYDDGLTAPWTVEGIEVPLVWMNPPFGKRNGVVPWLERFFDHGNGLGIVNALTSSEWFYEWMSCATGLLFPRGKTKFLRPDGSVAGQPASGIVIFSAGETARLILKNSEIEGLYLEQCHDYETG